MLINLEDKLFDNIKKLVDDMWLYRFITVICCIGIVVLFCVIVINFAGLKSKIDLLEKNIAILEKDNKDLNFEIGKAQGMATENK